MFKMQTIQLNEVISHKDNNFNLIRMVAAIAVIISHSFALAIGERGTDPLYSLLGMSLGEIAVNLFFITSGLLVTQSLCLRNNLRQFIIARALRIYPALIVSVVFCILLGGILTTFNFSDYFSSNELIKFILYNSTIIITDYQTLPGVFATAPYDPSINGSLWTLPWELRMYLVLLGAGLVKLISQYLKIKVNIFTIVIIAIACTSTYYHFQYHFSQEVHWFYSKAARFLSAFFLGASIYIFKDYIRLSSKLFISFCILIVIAYMISKLAFFAVFTLLSPYIILYVAYIPKGRILNYNKLGDYSYGTYIYAWPIQQTLAVTFIGITPIIMMLLTFILTLLIAALSWHYVEKPSMKLKRHFI